jgi:hypothetical protein
LNYKIKVHHRFGEITTYQKRGQDNADRISEDGVPKIARNCKLKGKTNILLEPLKVDFLSR